MKLEIIDFSFFDKEIEYYEGQANFYRSISEKEKVHFTKYKDEITIAYHKYVPQGTKIYVDFASEVEEYISLLQPCAYFVGYESPKFDELVLKK